MKACQSYEAFYPTPIKPVHPTGQGLPASERDPEGIPPVLATLRPMNTRR